MSQRPSFDLSRLSTATKILAGAGLLYFIDLFLPWNRKCFDGFGCGTLSGWHGALGVLCGVLIILILLMEALVILEIPVNVGTPMMRNQVEAGGAGLLLLLTILRVFIKPSYPVIGSVGTYFWAWIGLVLALVIAYGGYMRWSEASVATPAPPSSMPPPSTPPTTPPSATPPEGGYNP